MFILGIDPGYDRLGVSILSFDPSQSHISSCKIEYITVLSTSPQKNIEIRLLEIENQLLEIFSLYKNICVAGVEEVFLRKYLDTGYLLLQARGVILATLAKSNIPIIHCNPRELKKFITGSGKATKKEVQKRVQQIFSLSEPPKPDDAADALGIAFSTWLSWRGRK